MRQSNEMMVQLANISPRDTSRTGYFLALDFLFSFMINLWETDVLSAPGKSLYNLPGSAQIINIKLTFPSWMGGRPILDMISFFREKMVVSEMALQKNKPAMLPLRTIQYNLLIFYVKRFNPQP